MQGLSFRWQDLFEFADEAFAKVLGPDALRRIIDSEGAVIGTGYRDFRDFFASLSQSVYMGYVQAPETGYLGMFYAYQFSDEAAAEQFVQRQIGTGLDFKNFPLQKRRLHGHDVWVRDRQTLEQMYKARRLPVPAGSPEQWATPLGLEAFVVVDRWVVQCDQPALTHLIAQAEIDQRLTDLDNDIRQVLRASGRTVKPFALRWVKPQHWRTKYGLGTPLPAEDEQSESERSPRSSRAGAADRNRSRQEAADEPDPADSGINRVSETEIMEALNQLFYDEFGGQVIAVYTEESYLKLEIRAFKSDTQPQD
jgi:hypothetical protein